MTSFASSNSLRVMLRGLPLAVARHDGVAEEHAEQVADVGAGQLVDGRERLDLALLPGGLALLVEDVGLVAADEHGLAHVVDGLALGAHHVVVFEQVLADVEVALLHLLLRVLDALGDPGVLDGLVVGHAHALHQVLHPVAGEDAHQVVLEGQVELAHARVALAAGAAAELVVDAARLVALGAEDVEAADLAHLVALGHALGADLLDEGLERLGLGLGDAVLLLEPELGEHLRVAAEHDVGAAAGHVGGDGDGALAPGLGDDERLVLVVLGVEDVVGDLLLAEDAADGAALLDAGGADEDGLPLARGAR